MRVARHPFVSSLQVTQFGKCRTKIFLPFRRQVANAQSFTFSPISAELLSRDFYTRELATVRSLAALPIKHRLASQIQISISQLKNVHFLQVSDLGAPTVKIALSTLRAEAI
jgi:hypothetical protein